jgi:hypothetical protein
MSPWAVARGRALRLIMIRPLQAGQGERVELERVVGHEAGGAARLLRHRARPLLSGSMDAHLH